MNTTRLSLCRPALVALALSCQPLAAFAADSGELAALGKALFLDPALSVNGTQSCASCHDPAAGFAGMRIMEGAVDGLAGNRKPPTLAYQGDAPALHHTMTDEGLTFVGGDFLDGRARGDVTGAALSDQAMGPFLNPQEMAMPDTACVVLRACESGNGLADLVPDACAALQQAAIGAACSSPTATIQLDDAARGQSDAAFGLIATALAAYERSAEVQKFTSKFDDVWRGTGTLSAQEQAGYALFTGKAKCAMCHVDTPSAGGAPPVFTDYTYDNLGVPKNPANPWYSQPANPAGKAWIDKGLAVTLRADPVYAPYADDRMGAFKVPTLRNLFEGTGRTYMHNGWFTSVEAVVHFYNTRDTLPRCATPVTDAEAMVQGCWPAPEVAATMNPDELGNLKLTAAEEADLVAFLHTLTDR